MSTWGPRVDIRSAWATIWRSFRISAWLGWQIESNWADPFLFAIYSLIKPLASVAILVVMYGVISRGHFDTPIFSYIYVGNAFYIYVGQVMTGISYAVIEDREHYKTLKYMYAAPIHYPTYLFGRGVARFLIASISVLITLAVGVIFLQVRILPLHVNWVYFLFVLVVGVNMLALMGLILASVMLLLVHHMWGIGEAVAGALFLFTGAIFPLEQLPPYLRVLGYMMPVTYWLELVRRTLIGPVAGAFPTLAGWNDMQLLAVFLGLTAVLAVSAFAIFKWCDRRARERSLLDVVTNY